MLSDMHMLVLLVFCSDTAYVQQSAMGVGGGGSPRGQKS